VSGQLHDQAGERAPGAHWIGGWVDLRELCYSVISLAFNMEDLVSINFLNLVNKDEKAKVFLCKFY
jgi:hypothetical protein